MLRGGGAQLDIISHGGVGDVIMCTPVLRELRRRNPDCRIRFYSKYSPLVAGLPYIDEALPREFCPYPAIEVNYWDDDSNPVPLRGRLISLLGDRLGLKRHRPAGRLRHQSEACRALPGRLAVAAAPVHRDQPARRRMDPQQGVAGTLLDRADRAPVATRHRHRDRRVARPALEVPGTTYIDLRGRTSVTEMAAVLAAADLHVGPESGPMHIAAAVNTPCVILYGGYLPTFCTHYARNIALATDVPCAPCWLPTPCPFELKCMTAITPETVENSVWNLWTGSPEAGT